MDYQILEFDDMESALDYAAELAESEGLGGEGQATTSVYPILEALDGSGKYAMPVRVGTEGKLTAAKRALLASPSERWSGSPITVPPPGRTPSPREVRPNLDDMRARIAAKRATRGGQ